MKNYGFIFLQFFFCTLQAQVADHFSDGDFALDPVWSGSTGQFIVNSTEQLQLNNTVAGSSYLSTPFETSLMKKIAWQVYVRQSFSPSGNNYGRVYLSSDRQDLAGALNGYYLQLGEAGSNDAIQLIQQTGLESTVVCRAANGAIANSFAVRIQVQLDETGFWKLWADYSGGTNFSLEATGIDQKHQNSAFLGVFCNYTSSNGTKFIFDDFIAGPLEEDHLAPTLESVDAIAANQLSAHFSERLDSGSAASVSNYSANDLGIPITAVLRTDQSIIDLTFAGSFGNGVQNMLSVSGLKDLAGNVMEPAQKSFMFFQPIAAVAKDVILTEIFADPVPQIGLPEAEFVELHNRSGVPFDLQGWKLGDGRSTITLPSQIIAPGRYCILTAAAHAQSFADFGVVVEVPVFLTLNNDGDTLILKNPDGVTIDSLNYSTSWYHDAEKETGGWSLELIDPGNPCGEEDNWTASEDPAGGTPGKQNSVFASKPDRTGPLISGIVPILANELTIIFNEKLEDVIPSSTAFTLTPAVPVINVNFPDRSRRRLRLRFGQSLQPGQRYSLKVQNIRDCNENLIQEDFSQLDFALAEPADSADIVINEILFNPRPNGVDFVEVYNRSGKYVNLRNWKLANFENNAPTDAAEITLADLMMPPDSYRVFTTDAMSLKNNYPHAREENFIIMKVPAMPDDFGSIAMVDDRRKVIDHFLYTKDFHAAIVRDDEGVSLERISFSNATNNPQNWKSASSQAGFATPGYINSNAHPEHPVSLGNVLIEPEIFIPSSGGQDFAKINYAFDQSGYIANIKVLDQQGRLIKVIANNETLGSIGFFRWDGDRDDGAKTRIGYYSVWVEVFDLAGVVKTFRKRVIVATR